MGKAEATTGSRIFALQRLGTGLEGGVLAEVGGVGGAPGGRWGWGPG